MDIFETHEEFECAALLVISAQGWVREFELALLLGIQPFQLQWVISTLVQKKEIHRLKIQHDAGWFCQLTKYGAKRIGGVAGKKLDLPKNWRHDCMAIQAGMYLANKFGKKFTSDAVLQKKYAGMSKKIPDGEVGDEILIEQESARKTGRVMRRQAESIIEHAKKGKISIVSYPFPIKFRIGTDHEKRMTNVLRAYWGNGPTNGTIKLLRCVFVSFEDYLKAMPAEFELIELPPAFKMRGEDKRVVGQQVKCGHIQQVTGPNYGWNCQVITQDNKEGRRWTLLLNNSMTEHWFKVMHTSEGYEVNDYYNEGYPDLISDESIVEIELRMKTQVIATYEFGM